MVKVGEFYKRTVIWVDDKYQHHVSSFIAQVTRLGSHPYNLCVMKVTSKIQGAAQTTWLNQGGKFVVPNNSFPVMYNATLRKDTIEMLTYERWYPEKETEKILVHLENL